MTDRDKLDLIYKIGDEHNKLSIEEKQKMNRYSTSIQLLTLYQIRNGYKDDITPNLEKKIKSWEDSIYNSMSAEIDKELLNDK